MCPDERRRAAHEDLFRNPKELGKNVQETESVLCQKADTSSSSHMSGYLSNSPSSIGDLPDGTQLKEEPNLNEENSRKQAQAQPSSVPLSMTKHIEHAYGDGTERAIVSDRGEETPRAKRLQVDTGTVRHISVRFNPDFPLKYVEYSNDSVLLMCSDMIDHVTLSSGLLNKPHPTNKQVALAMYKRKWTLEDLGCTNAVKKGPTRTIDDFDL